MGWDCRIRSVLVHDLEGVTYMVSADTEGILKMWEIVSPKLLRCVPLESN